jgi:hypothetical protein
MKRMFALLAVGVAACGGTEPSGGISFKPDAASCAGSAVVDLFIDGSKVGSPTLSAGVGSEFFPVVNGPHVASAVSSSGATWPSESVTVSGPTTVVLACSANRPLAAFQANLVNRLRSDVIITQGQVTDTIPANATTVWRFIGGGGFSWRPVPLRFSDGTAMTDDNLVGGGTMTDGGSFTITARDILGQQYFTFDVANNSGAAISIGVFSGVSLRCISNLPASAGTFAFGYYQLRSGVEVHAYRNANCSGNAVGWNTATLSSRNTESGFIALSITTPP